MVVVSAYAPQVSLEEEVKRNFQEDLDELVRGISLEWDFNGHIGRSKDGYNDM